MATEPELLTGWHFDILAENEQQWKVIMDFDTIPQEYSIVIKPKTLKRKISKAFDLPFW